MRKFFAGWKRKVGVLTLVMALVLMTGWVRSKSSPEVASILISGQTQLFIDSDDGIFCFGRFLAHDPDYFSTQPTMRWVQYKYDQHIREEWEGVSWYWRCFDVGIVGHYSGAAPQYDYPLLVFIPYYSITIPLTLLSAFLLLSKPRQSTSKKMVEPSANEGI